MSIMASGRKRVRFTLEVPLPSEEARTAFSNRLSSVKRLLSPPGGPTLDSLEVMVALFDLAERASRRSNAHSSNSTAPTGGFLPFSGTYIKCHEVQPN